MKVTIDRSKWRCGCLPNRNGTGPTSLLNEYGYMCCLGFVAKAYGLDEGDIFQVSSPHYSTIPKDHPYMQLMHSPIKTHISTETLMDLAIDLNDGDALKFLREEKLINLFSSQNVEIEFIGDYVNQ